MVFFLMLVLLSQGYEDGGKHCEYIGLNETDKDIKE